MSNPAIREVTTAVSEQDWQARVDLAAALRLAAHFGFNEAIDNHFSYALPGRDDRFLLNPYGLHWSEVRASDLIEVDEKGHVTDGQGEAEPTAFCIHSRVHVRHKKARCVLHTHMPYATSLTMLEDPRLKPYSQTACMFHDAIAYDEGYNGLADFEEEGDRIASALGDKRVLFLANHGVIVTADSIARAFGDLYYLERACQAQVLALSTGQKVRAIGDNVAANTFGGHEESLNKHAEVHFAALKRILDRENPGYDA